MNWRRGCAGDFPKHLAGGFTRHLAVSIAISFPELFPFPQQCVDMTQKAMRIADAKFAREVWNGQSLSPAKKGGPSERTDRLKGQAMIDTSFSRDPKGFSRNRSTAIEPLEPRMLMSGDVSVGVVRGSLVIRGDAAANHIAIDQTGLTARQFRITGQDGTKINGQDELIISDVKHDVRVRLGTAATCWR